MKALRSIIPTSLLSVFSLFIFCNNSTVNAQEEGAHEKLLREKAIKVFLDMRGNRAEYIKREVPYINYVRDRKQAQLYIMETRQSTGAGGSEYTITLIGQQGFQSVNDTLKYISKASDTDDMTRSGIVKILKIGLMRYVEKTPLVDYITTTYQLKSNPTDVIDKWNYWVFSTRFNYEINKRESRDVASLDGSFSADRVTPELKTSLYVNSEYEKEKYKFSNGKTYTSISNF